MNARTRRRTGPGCRSERGHRILGDAVPLRAQVEMQAVHTHAPGRIAQALAHEPAQRLDLRHLVALDHIAKEHAVHIALQQFDARGEREPLRLRESPLDQKLAEALLDERSLDWCRPKSARRESLRADEPETTSSMRSVSSTRRQKRSHPGTSWIS